MLNFLDFLKDSGEDTSKTENVLKTKWDKTIDVIKEAFAEQYTTKDYATHLIQNEFLKTTPKSIDVDFLKENMNYIVEKIESLTEGDIKIIINNDVDKAKSNSYGCGNATPVASEPVIVTGGLDLEMEAAKAKGRGRPPKKAEEKKAEVKEETTITIEDRKSVV